MRDLPDADVYHLHWVGNCLHHHAFLDYAVFFARVPQGTPVVWTLHDMNAFTGGCHYDLGCGGYTHGCGRCPQLGSDAEDDLSRRIWEEKRGVFSRVDPSRLRFVSPSRWLAEAFRISVPGRRFPVSVIPAGLDTGDFAPRDRAACRDILGLPRDGGVVLFLADEMDNLRKGFDLMVAAIRALPAGAPVTVLSVGRNRPDVQIRVPWVHAGPVDDERQLSAVYSAADLFVIPSRQDNLPNTVMESMACGTPVVGHNVGGIPEMVRHGETGLHVPPGDAAAMAGAIASLLGDPPRLAAMSANCRRLVMEEYPLALHARRYLGIYGMVTGTDVI
jgi:glycosyltransferase involved in cell wall biosynthesis